MGKRKIGEIYNKPIVEGDINLKTPNEIHKSELSGGGNNSSELANPYYIKNVYGNDTIYNGSVINVFDMLFGILNGVVFGVAQTNGSTLNFGTGMAFHYRPQLEYIRAYQIFPTKKEIIDPYTNKTVYIDTTSLKSIVNMVTVNEEYCRYLSSDIGSSYEELIELANTLLTEDKYITEKEFYDFVKSY